MRAEPAGSAGRQCRWLEVDACLPHKQGADRLRFVPLGAAARAYGGKPTRRGLPPAAFWKRCLRESLRIFRSSGAPDKQPLTGKPLRKQFSPATNQNQARQLCSAFAPQGQTASPPHTGSAPCPRGTRQRRPTHAFADGRPLLVGLPPSTSATAPTETKRSAPAPCSWGGRASSLRPKTQAGGTAAPSYPHIFP